tara:strand:+ start:1374 stop:1568 length:195 start_codon:yes stop_codon:yes gene_type:complete
MQTFMLSPMHPIAKTELIEHIDPMDATEKTLPTLTIDPTDRPHPMDKSDKTDMKLHAAKRRGTR